MRVPTLLVPGLNCSARVFRHQIPMLWKYGPVHICDHTQDETVSALAQRILQEAPPRFVLIGFSLGGFVAFELWRHAPERIAGLVLMSTSARPESEKEREVRESRVNVARNDDYAKIPPLHFAKNVHPIRQTDDHLRAEHRQMTLDCGMSAYLRQQAAIGSRPDSRDTLATITCPTLVLVGDTDFITPPDHAREIAEHIQGARLVVIPNCGHLAPLEQPEQVNTALEAWREGVNLRLG
jgi:Predicted hydrolases or acyltransferases (alpha/beta hydrolase superfamily)